MVREGPNGLPCLTRSHDHVVCLFWIPHPKWSTSTFSERATLVG